MINDRNEQMINDGKMIVHVKDHNFIGVFSA
jgi:hypothetical protein